MRKELLDKLKKNGVSQKQIDKFLDIETLRKGGLPEKSFSEMVRGVNEKDMKITHEIRVFDLKNQLNALQKLVDELRSTSSTLDKVEIIKKYSINKVLMMFLLHTYGDFFQYHVTSKNLIKNKHLVSKIDFRDNNNHPPDFFTLLKELNKRTITGHDAIATLNKFILELNPDHRKLIYCIIDKDLEIGAGAKLINKAVPGMIPEFNVALAQKYEPKLANFSDEKWFVSRKLDGVRCIAIVNPEGECKLFSRQGKEFHTLNKVKEAIESSGIINIVFDGEVCILDENGDENFQGIMKEIRRKNHTIENPRFLIFDMIMMDDFILQKGKEKLSSRLLKLSSYLESFWKKHPNNTVLQWTEQAMLTSNDHFKVWNTLASDNNWEGIMLRKDTEYEGKRTKNLLKVKKFHDAEYVVLDAETEDMRVVRDGAEYKETMLAQVWIEHKGHKVKVGSGFNQEQRLKYTDKNKIIGKTITVQYFEETKNDKGGISLRFPTVKHVYDKERDS